MIVSVICSEIAAAASAMVAVGVGDNELNRIHYRVILLLELN